MADTARNDPQVVRQLAADLDRYLREALAGDQAIGHAQNRIQARLQAETSRRRGVKEAAEQAYERCCGCEGADCSPERRALDTAIAGWEAALRATAMFNRASETFAPAKRRFARVRTELVAETDRLLGEAGRHLDDYNRAAAAATVSGGGGGSSGGGGGSMSGGGSGSGIATTGDGLAVPAGFPSGYAMVPLSRIDLSRNDVTGPESFRSDVSPGDLEWGFEAFNGVILRALAAGKGIDYFQDRDLREGLVGSRSYTDTYTGFLGSDQALQLARRADGTFAVENGHHRIWVAQRLGLSEIPARVVRG